MTASLDEAMTALRAGDVNHAGDICDGILARAPDHPQATYVSGLVQYQRNEIKPAIETLIRAITLDPSSANYFRSLASIFTNTGAHENAARFYEHALMRDPNDAQTHIMLADALKDLGNFDGAFEHYREGLRLRPDHTKTRQLIDKLEMVIDVSRAMLAARDGGKTLACDLGRERFGSHAELKLPRSAVDFVQTYKNNLDTRANAYNTGGFDGAFGAEGAVLPHYLAEWIYDDYLSIRHHLPETVGDILDIGCGFGGLAALLHLHYGPDQAPRFHLVEQARIPGTEFSRPTPDAPALEPLVCARELLVANGIENDRVITVASSAAEVLSRSEYDLIVSVRSWCYLYPVETYIETARTALRPGGILLVDVNKKLGGLAALREHLPDAHLVSDRQDLVRCLYTKPDA